MITIYFIASILTFCAGKYIDKTGHRTPLMISSSIFFAFGYLLLTLAYILLTTSDGIRMFLVVFAIINIGIGAGCFFGSIWNSIPFLVDEKCYGITIGFFLSITDLFKLILTFILPLNEFPIDKL